MPITLIHPAERTPTWISRLPFYYGWINVSVAALAMTATLPGRTHGLGLIATPLIEERSLGVTELLFGTLNFWAILLGSALCLPVGRLIDRFGVRTVLFGVTMGLGGAVLWMSSINGIVALFIALVLVRGLGQGALSVVSMAMIGKWFTRRLSVAMGVFTVLLAFGFIASTLGVGEAVKVYGWREAWHGVGLCLLLGLAPLGILLVRSTPEAAGLTVEIGEPGASATGETRGKPSATPVAEAPGSPQMDATLGMALCTPAFWVFSLATAMFGFTWSAITLFNEAILKAQGFDKDTFILVMAVLVFSGLPSNLLSGWLLTRWPMGRLLAIGMLLFAASLAAFPWLRTTPQVIAYAATFGIAGGIITVVFFSAFGHAFGRTHLGAIQAAVQVISVFASALGPLLLAWCKQSLGTYAPLFYISSPLAVVFAAAVWFVPLPNRSHGRLACGETGPQERTP